jgi:predicted metal-dependent peptidase
MSTVDRVTQAKAMLIFNQPFYATIASSIEIVFLDDGEKTLDGQVIETMATDMERIYVNRKFAEGLDISECAGVLMHEVLHIAFMHGLRRGYRDPLLWNLACDYAINPIVLESGGKLPILPGGTPDDPGYCYDKKYVGWSANQIYEDLLQNAPKKKIKLRLNGGSKGGDNDGSKEDQGTPLWGEILDPINEDGSTKSQSEVTQLEEDIRVGVKQAADRAKAIGKLPGSLKGLIEAVGKSKVDWHEYIQRWVTGLTPDNYTWRRPNRKIYANYGIYMPSIEFNGSGVGALSIDTSGSVSNEELVKYITEITGVIELCNPDKLYLIQHDAVVHSVTEWDAGEDFRSLKITGRGGTNITPSFEKIEELDDVDWMIIFSDCEIGDWPKEEPDFPLLICTTGSEVIPYGTLINLRDPL